MLCNSEQYACSSNPCNQKTACLTQAPACRKRKPKHPCYTLEQRLQPAAHIQSLPPVNHAREHPYKIVWWSSGLYSRSYVRPSCSTMSQLSLNQGWGVLVHALQGLFSYLLLSSSHRVRIISPNTPAVGEEVGEGCTWLPHWVVSMKFMHKTTSKAKILES